MKNLSIFNCSSLVAILAIFQFGLFAQTPPDTIRISTAEQLMAIGGELSAGKYFILTNDLNVTTDWKPIYDFRGSVFDGKGYSINNLKINRDNNYVGLFGVISANNVAIKNVKVNITCYTGYKTSRGEDFGGGLVAINNKSIVIENCHIKGNIEAVSNYERAYSGGLVGYSDGEILIKNSSVIAEVYAFSELYRDVPVRSASGGLVGYSNGILKLENSFFKGKVTSHSAESSHAGGILGYCNNKAIISNCYSSDDISTNNGNAGGIIGRCDGDGTIIENSYCTGNISISEYRGFTRWNSGGSVGGVVGSSSVTILIKNCYSTGNVIGSTGGGIIGLSSGKTTIENCYATGKKMSGNVGGIIGYGKGITTILNSYSSNEISGAPAGGLIGVSSGNCTITNCYNNSNISSKREGGGLIGVNENIMTILNCYVNGNLATFTEGGGIVGNNKNSLTVSSCYINGNITSTSNSGSSNAGGIVGITIGTVGIKNCFVNGTVSATAPNTTSADIALAGGIVGKQEGTGSVNIDKCYVIGNVSANSTHAIYDVSQVGRFSTASAAKVTNSYYLSTQAIKGSKIINTGGASLTPEEMKIQSSFADWDFTKIWDIKNYKNNGYPFLRSINN